MAIDAQPLLGNNPVAGLGVVELGGPVLGVIPPPPPAPAIPSSIAGSHPQVVPQDAQFHEDPMAFVQVGTPLRVDHNGEGGTDAMDMTPTGLPDGVASTAVGGGHSHHTSRNRQASGAGPVPAEAGPSTASILAVAPGSSAGSGTASRSPSRNNGNSPAGL